MPFYKRIQNNQLLVAEIEVTSAGVSLLAVNHELYNYPVDGWYWFDTAEEAEINIPKTEESNPAPQAVTQVTMRQARLALFEINLLDKVERAIKGMRGTEGKIAQIEWESASVIDKNHPLIKQLMPILNLTDSDLDSLFQLASTK